MSWKENYWKFRHSMFVVFIELKITGSWTTSPHYNMELKGDFMVSTGGKCEIQIIEPDGLRRHLSLDSDEHLSVSFNLAAEHR